MSLSTLSRQLLLDRAKVSVSDCFERLVAVQAQLARPPFIGLWSRLEKFDRADLLKLLKSRKVVRATTFRGTLHLMTSRDYLAMRAAIQPGLDKGLTGILGPRLAKVDVPGVLDHAREFFATPHTFDDFRREILARTPKADERAMAYVVRLTLPLVQVPTDDDEWGFPGQAGFVTAESWLGKQKAAPLSMGEILTRYLAAYGPASIADMQAWTGMPALKPVVDDLRGELVVTKPGRTEWFDVAKAPIVKENAAVPARFLPDYDHLLVGRADDRFLDKAQRNKVFLPGLRVAPTLLIDGRVAGVWAIEKGRGAKARPRLQITPFATIPRARRSDVESEGAALLTFVTGGDGDVAISR